MIDHISDNDDASQALDNDIGDINISDVDELSQSVDCESDGTLSGTTARAMMVGNVAH